MRILVAGGSRLLRELLTQFLSSLPDFEVCGDVEAFEEVLEQCAALRPDLALIDLRQAGQREAVELGSLAGGAPEVRIVSLTEAGAPLPREMANRIAANLTDNLTLSQFADALRAAGHTQPGQLGAWQVVDRSIARPPGSAILDVLSPRELEVLALLAEGIGNREIGERLFVSEFTVKAHLRRIYRKLGITGRAKACLFAAGLMGSTPRQKSA